MGKGSRSWPITTGALIGDFRGPFQFPVLTLFTLVRYFCILYLHVCRVALSFAHLLSRIFQRTQIRPQCDDLRRRTRNTNPTPTMSSLVCRL